MCNHAFPPAFIIFSRPGSSQRRLGIKAVFISSSMPQMESRPFFAVPHSDRHWAILQVESGHAISTASVDPRRSYRNIHMFGNNTPERRDSVGPASQT